MIYKAVSCSSLPQALTTKEHILSAQCTKKKVLTHNALVQVEELLLWLQAQVSERERDRENE